jgi:hypothetical protein
MMYKLPFWNGFWNAQGVAHVSPQKNGQSNSGISRRTILTANLQYFLSRVDSGNSPILPGRSEVECAGFQIGPNWQANPRSNLSE